MNREIIVAIQRERNYQDQKWGDNPHDLWTWITIMERQLDDAGRTCFMDDAETLRKILQTVAVGVACLEQHGIVERENKS